MKDSKRKAVEAAGWSVGTADEFLGLTKDESAKVTAAVSSAFAGLHVPDGWTLEELPRQPDYALVTTPPPRRYMATVDLRLRGFRSGCSTSGRLFGEDWNKPRKKYVGRGWKQAVVDDAVAHLAEVLK